VVLLVCLSPPLGCRSPPSPYPGCQRPNLSVQISEEQAQSLSPILPSHSGSLLEAEVPSSMLLWALDCLKY